MNTSGAQLGIDAGGSSTRWLLTEGGLELGRGSLPSLSGPLYNDEARRETFARFAAIARSAMTVGRPKTVVAGVTGLDEGTPPAHALAELLATELELESSRVRVVNDMRIAYRAAFEPQQGILVYAGTGSIACCEVEDGRLIRAGGHGYLIDDAGGGFWIGSYALRVTVRAWDEGRDPGPLAKEIGLVLEAHDWPTMRAIVYGAPRSKVASLAPAVAAAAAKGDEEAASILQEAGRELGRLARVLQERLGRALPVAMSGGIARLGQPLTGAVEQALTTGSRFEVLDLEPVEAAARMAGELEAQLQASGRLSP